LRKVTGRPAQLQSTADLRPGTKKVRGKITAKLFIRQKHE